MTELPSYAAIQDALLAYLRAIDSATLPCEAYWSLAEHFNLSHEQLALRRADNRGFLWENRVQWAKRQLVAEGLMDRHARGVWALTPQLGLV